MEVDTVDAPLARADHDNGALVVAGAKPELRRSKTEIDKQRRIKQAQRAYGRGRKIDVHGIKDKKLRRNLTNLENKYQSAALKAKEAEILLENTGGFLEPETELVRGPCSMLVR